MCKERSSLQIRHVSVRLDDLPAEDERRGYGVSLASFQSRKGTALDNFAHKIEAQMARNFKKLSLDSEYITYLFWGDTRTSIYLNINYLG